MKAKLIRAGWFVLIASAVAAAQARPPEMDFPSANGKHEGTIKVQKIRGIVVDENGAVIAKVQIEVRPATGQDTVAVAKGWTDAEGRFQFDVSGGRYGVVFRMRGFKEETLPVLVSRRGAPGFKMALKVERTPIIDRITPIPE